MPHTKQDLTQEQRQKNIDAFTEARNLLISAEFDRYYKFNHDCRLAWNKCIRNLDSLINVHAREKRGI